MPRPETTRVPAGSGRSGGNDPRCGDERRSRDERRGRSIVAALAVTQTVGYGALYYAFAVFLSPLAHDLGTSTTAVAGALTVSTLVGAAAAVPVGRWLDRHGARGLMTAGSVAGTALLVGLAHVHTIAGLYAVWIGIGLASAAVLYEAAFAVVVTWFTDARRRANALLAITVVAGFASSVFLPLTGHLVDRYGWRATALLLAVIHGTLTIPLHAALVRRAPTRRRPVRSGTGSETGPDAERRAAVRAAAHDRTFWVLAVGFVANATAVSALAVHLVSFLVELGHRVTFAATAAGLLGVLSVTGRLAVTGLQRRVRPTAVVAAVFAVQALAAASLPVLGRTAVGAIVGVVGFGLGFGVATIARPALLAERYATTGYASIAGLLAVPVTAAKAVAPVAAAALHAVTGGYTPVMAGVSAACGISAVAIAAVGRRPPLTPRREHRTGNPYPDDDLGGERPVHGAPVGPPLPEC